MSATSNTVTRPSRWVVALSDEVENPMSPAYVAIEITQALRDHAEFMNYVLDAARASFETVVHSKRHQEVELSFPFEMHCVAFDDLLPGAQGSIMDDEREALIRACDHLSEFAEDESADNPSWALLDDGLGWEALWITLEGSNDSAELISNDPAQTMMTAGYQDGEPVHLLQMLMADGSPLRVLPPVTDMIRGAGFEI